MAFCEDCGSPLTPGVIFCENCGAKISSAKIDETGSGRKITEHGIIYTNLKLLSEKSGKPAEELKSIVAGFISDTENRGVGYELVDVSEKLSEAGKVREHIEIIKPLVEKKHPKYLFILGSYNVIPSITWENFASDRSSDSDVTSDLPFATLDATSPFDGTDYDFDDCLRVGRLPTVDFENYFANLNAVCGKVEQIKTFSLSAEVWQNETKDIYKDFAAGPAVMTSPEVSMNSVQNVLPSDSNLLLFNLHGSRQTEYWYGQRGSSYPEAMSHNSLDGISSPYFLAVEACYGAYYEGRTKENSVLLNALNGKCVTFLGSSRIAFGTPSPKGSCADVICGEFLKGLKENMSAGDALNKARKVLQNGRCSAEDIKTLAEFALYGDPSARMKGEPAKGKGLFGGKLFGQDSTGSFAKGIRIQLPDVRNAVRLELTEVDKKIEQTVESFVHSKHSDLMNLKPRYYRNSRTQDLNAVFESPCDIGMKIVNVQLDRNGQIQQMIESK